MKILFIQTGGTIDKDYPKLVRGYNFEITKPAVREIIKTMNPCFDFKIVSLFKKDSLDLTDQDRKKIYQYCKNTTYKNIIITHGTDTMVQTAKKLKPIKNKIIIITGSTKPAKFTNSDAVFNIGTAIGAIGNLKKGVYIAMNGRVYPGDKCKKDLKTGKFVKK